MQIFKDNDKINIYGNLNIKNHKNKIEENICISIENKSVERIGDSVYDFFDKQYQKFDYDWNNISKDIKTTKIIINDKALPINCSFSLHGYVEDKDIFSKNVERYNFYTPIINIEELIERIEDIYNEYICDFDTVKDSLKMIITKIEIY